MCEREVEDERGSRWDVGVSSREKKKVRKKSEKSTFFQAEICFFSTIESRESCCSPYEDNEESILFFNSDVSQTARTCSGVCRPQADKSAHRAQGSTIITFYAYVTTSLLQLSVCSSCGYRCTQITNNVD